ncbi:MAG: DUF2029 domain-containing protein, partial [Alphaproteobacteria bacterium]
NGRPLGTDFSNVYAAGKLTLQGTPQAAYDPLLQHAMEKTVFGGRDVPFYGWHYPPQFLLVAAVLALLPYGWALLAWMALTLPAYLAAVRAILPRSDVLIPAAAFPAVFVNLGHGQNGFLTAALLGGGLVLLERRPVMAGLLIGLLAYKPQFGVLIPLVLAVSGRWTAIMAAAATVVASCIVTLALFGSGIWEAFFASTEFTRSVVLEAGGTGWQKIQSIFAALRMWGAGIEIAYSGQLLLALGVAASLAWLWRSQAAFALKAAALATGSLLATPYVLDYDLVVLGVAIAFFAAHGLRHGFRSWEISGLAAAWCIPLVARSLGGALNLPFGLMALLALYFLTLRRAALDRAAASAPEPASHDPASQGRESLAEA